LPVIFISVASLSTEDLEWLWKTNASNNKQGILMGGIRIEKIIYNRDKCWWGCGEKGTLIHSLWECKLVQPLWKTVWKLLQKLKLELPYDSAIPLLGISQRNVSQVTIKTPYTMFIAALFTIAKLWKQPRCPSTGKCINVQWNFI
jgi:hypothetical protein